MKTLSSALIGLILVLSYSCSSHDFTCTLKGTLVDRKSDTLLLKRMNQDTRFVKIFIPIIDGKFEYKLDVKDIEAWMLIFKDERDKGAWKPITFFTDKKLITFELHPAEQSEKNIISGGELNKSYQEFYKKQREKFDPRMVPLNVIADSLSKNDGFSTKEFKLLLGLMDSAKTVKERDSIMKKVEALNMAGKHRTPEAINLSEGYQAISKDIAKYRYDYIGDNTNILSYSFILEDLLQLSENTSSVKKIQDVYPAFAKKFPTHPYTELTSRILDGFEKIRVGGQFVDFTLPDLNGEIHTLSQLITGKVAVIDLWATWCGPCIMHSRSMVPVYNDYQDKGFTIVGVAAEANDTDAMKKRLDKEKWPWIQLVELDHKNHIWDYYGASFSGGKVIMVDKNGSILAINPTAEEVRQKLEQIL
jgi:thiol-disulfide isomerase/thioredoxin